MLAVSVVVARTVSLHGWLTDRWMALLIVYLSLFDSSHWPCCASIYLFCMCMPLASYLLLSLSSIQTASLLSLSALCCFPHHLTHITHASEASKQTYACQKQRERKRSMRWFTHTHIECKLSDCQWTCMLVSGCQWMDRKGRRCRQTVADGAYKHTAIHLSSIAAVFLSSSHPALLLLSSLALCCSLCMPLLFSCILMSVWQASSHTNRPSDKPLTSFIMFGCLFDIWWQLPSTRWSHIADTWHSDTYKHCKAYVHVSLP